jgi:DNA/RNA endonuclease G (NUC1)
MVIRIRTTRRLRIMLRIMREETNVGARNQELEELQRIIEELEHKRDGDVATNSDSKAKSEIEQNTKDVYPA